MKIIDISYFVKAIHAAAQMGVNCLLIEPHGIRGIDEERTVVFFQKGRLPFGLVALGETIYLSKRLKLFKHLDEIEACFDIKHTRASDLTKQANLAKEYGVLFKVNNNENNYETCIRLYELIAEKIESFKKEAKPFDAKSNESGSKITSVEKTINALIKINGTVDTLKEHALSIYFSEGDISLMQRCVPPENIKAPKIINDTPKYLIDIKKSHISTLKSMCTAVRTDEFHLVASKAGVFLNVLDDEVSGSVFNIKIGEAEDGIEFDYRYITKSFVQLIKSDKSISIGEKGLLKATLDEFDFYLIPQC